MIHALFHFHYLIYLNFKFIHVISLWICSYSNLAIEHFFFFIRFTRIHIGMPFSWLKTQRSMGSVEMCYILVENGRLTNERVTLWLLHFASPAVSPFLFSLISIPIRIWLFHLIQCIALQDVWMWLMALYLLPLPCFPQAAQRQSCPLTQLLIVPVGQRVFVSFLFPSLALPLPHNKRNTIQSFECPFKEVSGFLQRDCKTSSYRWESFTWAIWKSMDMYINLIQRDDRTMDYSDAK